MSSTNLNSFLEKAKKNPGKVVVPCADNHEALEAIELALQDRIVDGGYFIGVKERIENVAKNVHLDLSLFEIIECADPVECAKIAVKKISSGAGDFLVKGQIDTKIYMKAILEKEAGLVPPGNVLSHVAVMEIPHYHKLLITADAAIFIEPTVEEKIKIVQNSVDFCQRLGIKRPKVAMIAAVEKVNPKMRSTVEAQAVVEAAKNGAVKGAVVEGPYDVYIATSKEAAAIKGAQGEVCGDADVLLFHDINAANAAYKLMSQFVPGIRCASLIAGAKIPIVLPSRADATETKRMSLVLAAALKNS